MKRVNSPELMKEYYAAPNCADGYVAKRFATPLGAALHRRQVETIRQVIGNRQPAAILELACGPARVTSEIDPGEAFALAVDANQSMLTQARRRLAAVRLADRWHLLRGDAFSLSLDCEFDIVYSFRFIRHFHLPERQRLYRTIREHLSPGGVVVFDAVNRRVAEPALHRHGGHMPVFDEYYDRPELRAELAEAGLRPLSFEPVHPAFRLQSQMAVLLHPRSPTLARGVVWALERLGRSQPLEWVVICGLA